MGEYPPKLLRIAETEFGSRLYLSDDRAVPIDISPDLLNRALIANQQPPLQELLAAQSLQVYAQTWETTSEMWTQICDAVLASSVAVAAFGAIPSLWETFSQPAAFVREMPQRVYGGLGPSLYALHPFHFRPDCSRSAPWFYGQLSAPGGRLFKTWVHLRSGEIEIDSGVLAGHFVE